MASFSDLAEACDEHLTALRTSTKAIGGASRDAGRAANADATKAIRDIERALKQMESEARGAPPTARRPLLETITKIKTDLASARTDLQKANDAVARADLMTGAGAAAASASSQERDRMIVATETASRTTAKLEQAQGILSETEDIGINVIDTMQQQRESILRSTAKAESTNALTDVARGILRGMQRSAITNKFLLAGIILVLLLAIGVVVYFGYIK